MKIFDSNYSDFNYSDSSVFVGAKFVEFMTYVLSLGIDTMWALLVISRVIAPFIGVISLFTHFSGAISP